MDQKWLNEPNEWANEMMFARRNDLGAWCGYVGITDNHPLFGKSYNDEVTDPNEFESKTITLGSCLDVHGGITFTGKIENSPNKALWWIGFDCAHAWDLVPYFVDRLGVSDGTYKDLEYVKRQILNLAMQLVKWKPVNESEKSNEPARRTD